MGKDKIVYDVANRIDPRPGKEGPLKGRAELLEYGTAGAETHGEYLS